MNEFDSTCQSSKKSISDVYSKRNQDKIANSEALYQKILHSEILEERTPSKIY
jgi:hypothetical protein